MSAPAGPAGVPPHLPRPERLVRILARDGEACVWCRRPLPAGHRDASLDHVVPRLKGGPAWPENELAACRSCNRRRGHRSPSVFLDDCEARGLEPDRAAVAAGLLRLRDAIEVRGGQRRARPYLDGQLRRLGLTSARPTASARAGAGPDRSARAGGPG